MSRKPSRNVLRQSVVIKNAVKDGVLNGAPVRGYQETTIRYVWAEFCKQTNILATGNTGADSLLVMIFPGVSIAQDAQGQTRQYLSPKQFAALKADKRPGYWTLDTTGDRIVFAGQDCRIHVVDAKYGNQADVHHWEVSAE